MTTATRKPGLIIPKEAASLRTLTATMAVMCYLACLAIGALILINQAVDNWSRGLSGEVTVQVREIEARDIDVDVAAVLALLRDTAGVISADDLGRAAAEKLLEPWLGTEGLDALPVPRILRVTVQPDTPPDYEDLAQKLAAVAPGASLDTHRRWEDQLTRMAGTLMLVSALILLLISGSAVAMVIFATRAVLDANRQTVDVLHLVGAEDGYIARAINRRFLATGLWAGGLGVLLALATFLLLGYAGLPQADGLASASRSLFYLPGTKWWLTPLALLAVPAVATLLALITSRITLLRMLRTLP
ncbi:MAG: ABC transporter permease [Phyllobacteriaceae bacterium]|jgi:cell division transport system permease protein|nr:ABC transporter permease [Phyllobacteriaceae bacterium]